MLKGIKMAKKKMFSEKIKQEIIELYLSGKSTVETGLYFGVTSTTVYNILKKNDIPRRTVAQGNALKWKDTEWKENQVNQRKGKPSGALNKKWKLTSRKFIPTITGENNPMWKGGKTKLGFLIRNCPEYKIWRKAVFERDNYTCVECGRRRRVGDRVVIEADHIYPFHKLLDDFFIKNTQQAIECEKLWDVSNGRTLCRECHKNTDTYGVNRKNFGSKNV